MTEPQATAADRSGDPLRPLIERSYLEGRYEALKWVLGSPAISRHVAERIEDEARAIIPRLEELGTEFREPQP